MCQVSQKQKCTPLKQSSLQPSWSGIIPKGMKQWTEPALGSLLEAHRLQRVWSARSTSPASPGLLLEVCTRRISEAFNKGPERKSSCFSVAHRILRLCANCTSQVVLESISPWHFSSPLFLKGQQQPWGGRH